MTTPTEPPKKFYAWYDPPEHVWRVIERKASGYTVILRVLPKPYASQAAAQVDADRLNEQEK